MTNVRLLDLRVADEARFRMPNLPGLKFSHNDLVELQECINADGGAFEVLFGFDEFLLAGLCLGVCGAVGSTYNFAGRHYLRADAVVRVGDKALAARRSNSRLRG